MHIDIPNPSFVCKKRTVDFMKENIVSINLFPFLDDRSLELIM